MNSENVITYLKDHLAGSVAAIELMESLHLSLQGKPEADEIQGLKTELEADQALLKNLLARLGVDEGGLKKTGALLAEKALQVKIKANSAELGTLESLELLSLGIEGKMRLWSALEILDLGLNLAELKASAAKQIELVETLRIKAAQEALL